MRFLPLIIMVFFVLAAYAFGRVHGSLRVEHQGGGAAPVAAAAMREVFGLDESSGGVREGPAYRDMAVGREDSAATPQDPYVAWLQAAILRQAAAAEAFVVDEDGVLRLCLGYHLGDYRAWYIGRVSRGDGQAADALPPTLLWRWMGYSVDPGEIRDPRPALAGVEPGDLVRLDLFRLARGPDDMPEEIDPTGAVARGEAELVLRLVLPVVLSDKEQPPWPKRFPNGPGQ